MQSTVEIPPMIKNRYHEAPKSPKYLPRLPLEKRSTSWSFKVVELEGRQYLPRSKIRNDLIVIIVM